MGTPVHRVRWPAALALLASLALLLPLGAVRAAEPGGGPVRLLAGSTPETTLFPSDTFTVDDSRQATGRRVSLPVPSCAPDAESLCDDIALLNELDGFDLLPRVVLPFSGPVNLDSVNSTTVYIDGPDGRVGLHQLVQDPQGNTVAGYPVDLLRERTTYRLVVTAGVLDTAGQPVRGTRTTQFTTLSATTELDKIRQALDSGSAYDGAGIGTGERGITFEQDGTSTVFGPEATVPGNMSRRDQTMVDQPPGEAETVPVLSVANVGTVAFGSLLTPRYARKDGTGAVIEQVPTTTTPEPLGSERIGVALIEPQDSPLMPKPEGGWPVAVYGPGFTRSLFDLFVTADQNAARGLATLSINPVGHGFGPASTAVVDGTEFLTYGRAEDVDGNGTFTNSEGVQPMAQDGEASPFALVALRDGLKQTVVDQMALIRAIERGVDVDGDGATDLATDGTVYYGLSFGGIYGTMLAGTDPRIEVAALNVPGGPIVDIARLSGFRGNLAEQLEENEPSLLNGGPGLEGFTESLPVPSGDVGGERVTDPAPGAIPIQQYFGRGFWLERSGGPEVYSPLLGPRPRAGAPDKTVLYQVAFGDNTVPNPTAGILVRAGDLQDRVTYYRNDMTPTRDSNPHGFLADPRIFGREQGQTQIIEFLVTKGDVVDPDGPGPIFEVPISNPRNLTCLHYPDPQTGQGAYPPPASGECPAAKAEPRATAQGSPGAGGDDAGGDDASGSGGTAGGGSAGGGGDGTGSGSGGTAGGSTTSGNGSGTGSPTTTAAGRSTLAATGGASGGLLGLLLVGGAALALRRRPA